MSYKSILTVLTDPKLAQPVLEQGTELAKKYDAHFEALCLGVDRSQTGYYYAGVTAMILQETVSRASREADALEAIAHGALNAPGVLYGTQTGVAQLADLGRHVAARARFADLVISPKPYGDDRGAELEPVIEAALFEGQAPVLVCPDKAVPLVEPKAISIAWNESSEALSAVRRSLPFLKSADTVRVVVIDPPTHGPSRSDPGGLLSQYLARHGVRVEIDVLSRTLPRISDVLLRHANDTATDLIVMGAYGHSRFREAILGGATRNMLEASEIPVLMAH